MEQRAWGLSSCHRTLYGLQLSLLGIWGEPRRGVHPRSDFICFMTDLLGSLGPC